MTIKSINKRERGSALLVTFDIAIYEQPLAWDKRITGFMKIGTTLGPLLVLKISLDGSKRAKKVRLVGIFFLALITNIKILAIFFKIQ